jgi:DNA-binding NarL/FixJ family response regulator
VAPEAHTLTRREVEVLRLLARGYSNDAIACALHLTRNTVKTHVAHLTRKLGVGDRGAAAARAVALGLLAGDAAVR